MSSACPPPYGRGTTWVCQNCKQIENRGDERFCWGCSAPKPKPELCWVGRLYLKLVRFFG